MLVFVLVCPRSGRVFLSCVTEDEEGEEEEMDEGGDTDEKKMTKKMPPFNLK